MNFSDLTLYSITGSTLLLGIIYYRYLKTSTIPRPKTSHWLFGSLPLLISQGSSKGLHLLFETWGLQGDVIIGFGFGILSLYKPAVIVINDPDVYKEYVSNPNIGRGNASVDNFEGIFTRSVIGIKGDENHVFQRKLLTPGFAPNHLRTAALFTRNVSLNLFRYFDTLGEERFQVDFTLVHPAITLDVIGGVLFGEDLEGIAHLKDGTCTPIVELIEKLSTIYVKKAMLPPFLRRVFGVHSGSATLKEIQTKLNMYLDEIITKLKTKDSGEKTLKDGVPLFQYLIRTTEADSGFQREDLLDNMKALYFGGYETTAHALNFLIWHLLKNPTCLQKVVEEIDEHYDVDFIEHLTSFKYLGNAIKESMRLDPVAIAVSREALADTTLAGYTIEKGTVVTINTIALQHNETFWPNPTTFNPDRFNNTTKPGTYFPFGEGTQNCIGQKLAMAEIKVYMIMLLKHYKLELVPGQDIRVVTRFTSDLNQLGVYLEKRV